MALSGREPALCWQNTGTASSCVPPAENSCSMPRRSSKAAPDGRASTMPCRESSRPGPTTNSAWSARSTIVPGAAPIRAMCSRMGRLPQGCATAITAYHSGSNQGESEAGQVGGQTIPCLPKRRGEPKTLSPTASSSDLWTTHSPNVDNSLVRHRKPNSLSPLRHHHELSTGCRQAPSGYPHAYPQALASGRAAAEGVSATYPQLHRNRSRPLQETAELL